MRMGNEVKPPSPMPVRGLFRGTILDVTRKFQNVLVHFYGIYFVLIPILYTVSGHRALQVGAEQYRPSPN